MIHTMADRIRRGIVQHGERFDTSDLDAVHPSIRRAYETDQRVEVTRTYDDGTSWVRRGRVSTTTGWRPAFILMARVNSVSSWDVLDLRDRVTKVVSV